MDNTGKGIPPAGGWYGTRLTPEQEAAYRLWVTTLPERLRSDYDYDLRGAWLAGDRPDGEGHMTDRWKKPWHPTFSEESVYSRPGVQGGRWKGETFVPSAYNRWVRAFTGANEEKCGGELKKCGGKLYAEGGNLFLIGGEPANPWHPPIKAYQIKGVMPAGMLLRKPTNGNIKGVPERSFNNDGPTAKKSEAIEDRTASHIRGDNDRINHAYDIPYIDSLEITVPKYGRVSTNALDSIAKYSDIAGIPLYEGLGLAAQETHFGAMPWYNFWQLDNSMTEVEKQNAKAYNRALANTSYFRNYGVIPANYLVRDYAYMIQPEGYKKTTPPLLHAFQYWKSGKYNSLDENHTSDVRDAGRSVMLTKAIQDWIEKSEYAKKALGKN